MRRTDEEKDMPILNNGDHYQNYYYATNVEYKHDDFKIVLILNFRLQ